MDIEFHCGVVAGDVGVARMAVRSHLSRCSDPVCRAECAEFLATHGDDRF